MTRDDIIRMAQESGMAEVLSKYDGEYGHDASKETEGFAELERFAALVAAAEREACAKICDKVPRSSINQAEAAAKLIRLRK